MTQPVPIGAHYVRGILQLSSCFGREVCPGNPCACAQSVLAEIERPLRAEIERLRAALQEIWNELGYMDGDKPHRLCGIARRTLEPKP